MAAPKKSTRRIAVDPADTTGVEVAEANIALEEERREAGKRMAMARAAAAEIEDSVTEVADRVVGLTVVDEPKVEIIAAVDIDCEVGQGNSYVFEAGRRYLVPQTVAEHLEEKRLVWH